METHQGILKYECDVCSKKFVTKERLFAHRRLHLGKRFLCSRCDFKARSSTALRNHIIMKHSERKFQCYLCSKKFGSKQNLEQHGVVHTGMTSWHCSICEMSFKRHHHFKAHMQRLILPHTFIFKFMHFTLELHTQFFFTFCVRQPWPHSHKATLKFILREHASTPKF